MSGILILLIFLNNGRDKWDSQYYYDTVSNAKKFISLCLRVESKQKKSIIKVIAISVVATLFMYKTCICFYNDDIGYYSELFGFGVNTYFTRLFQLKKSCPPGPPCQLYATIPEDPAHDFFLNVHTHEDVKNVMIYYR